MFPIPSEVTAAECLHQADYTIPGSNKRGNNNKSKEDSNKRK